MVGSFGGLAKRKRNQSRLIVEKLMILPALTLALLMQETPMKEYVNSTVDLKMKYPSEWELKKERLADQMRFTVDGKVVVVELMAIEMNFPASHWQEVTREINTNNNRAVLRQWEEEFLGVPLLYTKVRDITQADSVVIVSGLLMSNRPQKFLFRMTAPEAVAQVAEDQWNRVMLSADSVSGRLPSEPLPVTPAAGGTGRAPENPDGGKTHVLRPPDKSPKVIKIGEVKQVLDSSRGTFVYLPEGWEIEGSQISKGAIRAEFNHGVGEIGVARTEWLKACGKMLSRVQTIKSREEPELGYLETGFQGSYLLRRGTVGERTEVQWVGYGWKAGYYYNLSWSGTELEFKTAQSELARLHNRLAISAE